ncbi:MAG TPA: diguanylate cyclase [Polyangiaceae bacterium]|nr:diguanylate cyclase [Polyangiaceae bacterium]
MSPTNQDRTLAEQLSGAFVVFGALVAAAFVVTTLTYGIGRAWLSPDLERSRHAEKDESASFAAMLDEENGLRGYLMTHDPRFLEAFARGENRLPPSNSALTADVGSVPELAGAMIGSRLAEERWRDGWAKAAANTQADAVVPSMLSGKILFDAYRVEQTAFADALERHTERLSRREQSLIALRVVLELLVFVAILSLAVRQHRALHAAIVTPVAALLLHIRRIRDGELEAAPERAAPRELAELAHGLNEVVRSLAAARASAASRDETLGNHSVRLHQILDASREFSESLNLAYVVGAVRDSTSAIGGYERVIVWLMDDEQKHLVDSAKHGADADLTAAGVGLQLAERAAKSGRITFEGAAGAVRFSDSSTTEVCAIAIPLIVGARVVGVLEARHEEARVATKDVIEILEMLATHAATAIESARLHEVIEERSQVDPLTRLLNRRRLEEDLAAECKRCLRYKRPLAFVMLDVDHFKAFNDAHGHPKADTALQEVADIIAGCVRITDTAYRYGGEEFCILLRETTADDAMHFAERLRQRIEQRFESGEITGITASFGVADFSTDTPTPRALVEAADAAMYDSKHTGRNRVALSSSHLVAAAVARDEDVAS